MIGAPEGLSEAPEAGAALDVLSDVLQVLRLSGAVFFNAAFSAPFAVGSPPADELAGEVLPGAECLALFHVLTHGGCWVGPAGQPPVFIEAGDLIVFPRGHPHFLASDLDTKPRDLGELLPEGMDPAGLDGMVYGGGGEEARFICGFLRCDQRFNPLFQSLPSLLWVRSREGAATLGAGVGDARPMAAPTGSWLHTSLRYLMDESASKRPGNATMLSRLSELLFVEVVRTYIENLSPDETGWLAGLADPHVGPTLALIHAEPERAWTVEDLARRAGVSRSVLAERFARLIGESPMRYLASWRIHLARQLLSGSDLALAEIGTRVGYESEAAFSRAFKRHTGEPPAAWRKKLAASSA